MNIGVYVSLSDLVSRGGFSNFLGVYVQKWDCWVIWKLQKILNEMEIYQTALPVPWETCIQVKKQQLEPDME